MRNGVTVAQQTLTLFVRVRILLPQPIFVLAEWKLLKITNLVVDTLMIYEIAIFSFVGYGNFDSILKCWLYEIIV